MDWDQQSTQALCDLTMMAYLPVIPSPSYPYHQQVVVNGVRPEGPTTTTTTTSSSISRSNSVDDFYTIFKSCESSSSSSDGSTENDDAQSVWEDEFGDDLEKFAARLDTLNASWLM